MVYGQFNGIGPTTRGGWSATILRNSHRLVPAEERRDPLELPGTQQRVDCLDRHGRGRCDALDLHTAFGEQGHEVAAWLAVVVAVEGTAVDVGQLRCRDPELLRLRQIESAAELKEKLHRALGLRLARERRLNDWARGLGGRA